MGSIVRLCPVVTTQLYRMIKLVLVLSLAMLGTRAAPQLPPGVNPATCPNYPFCGPAPQGAAAQPQVPGLAAHAAAERAVIAQQGFTGLVGPSGNIGPSGLCGPSGCVQF